MSTSGSQKKQLQFLTEHCFPLHLKMKCFCKAAYPRKFFLKQYLQPTLPRSICSETKKITFFMMTPFQPAAAPCGLIHSILLSGFLINKKGSSTPQN